MWTEVPFNPFSTKEEKLTHSFFRVDFEKVNVFLFCFFVRLLCISVPYNGSSTCALHSSTLPQKCQWSFFVFLVLGGSMPWTSNCPSCRHHFCSRSIRIDYSKVSIYIIILKVTTKRKRQGIINIFLITKNSVKGVKKNKEHKRSRKRERVVGLI